MRISGGALRGRALKTVKPGKGPAGYRPATEKVRLAIFSMLEARGISWEETRVLDLFAGSGALAFEALSRGAPLAWFVERDKAAVRLLRENVAGLKLPRGNAQIIGKDLFRMLASPPTAPVQQGFELAFIDPPYGKDMLSPALKLALDNAWLAKDAYVLAEIEAGLDFAADEFDARLELLVDRTYGQTRILIWEHVNDSPSTPAPSTP